MRRLAALPLNRKLTLLTMLTTGIALLLAGIGIVLSQSIMSRGGVSNGALLATGGGALVILLAHRLAGRLRRAIVDPVLDLAASTAARATAGESRTVGTARAGGDELDRIADAFSHLFAQLQAREGELRKLRLQVAGMAEGAASLPAEVQERARMAEALGASEAFLNSLLEYLPLFIFRKDKQGRFTFANRRYFERVGRTKEETIGRLDSDFATPEFAAIYRRGDETVMNNRQAVEAVEPETLPSGDTRWIEIVKVPIFDAGQNVVGIQGMYWDVTARRDAEDKLEKATRQLIDVSRAAGMAEVATGVLHNVGNVLNSVNVSTTLMADTIRRSKAAGLGKLAALLGGHTADLPAFLTTDPRGRMVLPYLVSLAEEMAREQQSLLTEVEQLRKNVDHIKDIVAMQQSYARTSGVIEVVSIPDLVEDALRMNSGSLARHDIEVIRDYQARPVASVEKHKALQVLINLIRNAKYACDESGRTDKRMTLRVTADEKNVSIAVIDNGVGIPPENLTRIFNHGFTTRATGHGFGLHSGALAASEMGGSLLPYSEGLGKGAAFVLTLPFKKPESTHP